MNITARRSGRTVGALALAAVMLFGLSAPASAFLDKTRFVAHLGIAYYAFHHWVLKPYQEQKFASGAPHRTGTIVKGGIALLFAVHEVKVSEKIARESKDPLLQKLSGGLAGLSGSFGAVGQKLKSGQFSPSDVEGLTASTKDLGAKAAAGGAPIKDVPIAIPGA